LTGRVAVMDRYAVCQYASIRAHGVRGRAERLARFAYGLFPAPDVTFLLRVEPGIAYQRIELRGTDHESLEFLAKSAAAYRSLPEYGTFVTVDASGTPDDVTRAIRAYLASHPGLPTIPPARVVPAAQPAPAVLSAPPGPAPTVGTQARP
ncbi:MAG TPA: thymidylate kinase, partial [Pilimelia sp.]|nr:thymidylate kinase [Pilimelia sp.]